MGIRVGVIGFGFVGKAIVHYLETNGFEYWIYDKYIANYSDNLQHLIYTNLCFICVPTPFVEDIGYDISAIHDVLASLKQIEYKGSIVLKSTVLVGTTDELSKLYGLPVYHNPEFLTARNAIDDFKNQKNIIIGYPSNYDILSLETIKGFYKDLLLEVQGVGSPEQSISVVPAKQSECVKICCNSFYASKIQLFTEFYEFCQKSGVNYQSMKSLMIKNNWINPMHTDVPGADGKISFGGACLTKDISALVVQMENYGVPCNVLRSAIDERNNMRKD